MIMNPIYSEFYIHNFILYSCKVYIKLVGNSPSIFHILCEWTLRKASIVEVCKMP